MDTIDIKIDLLRKKISQTEIANRVGVAASIVNRVIARKVVSRRVAQGVADALGLPLGDVFPEYVESTDRRRAAG